MTTDSRPSISRRTVVGGAGVAMAGAAVSLAPSIAQGNDEMATEQELRNPTDQYPRPPYKKQSQPLPGLASKMGNFANKRHPKEQPFSALRLRPITKPSEDIDA
jgi:hypothetical protein